VFVLLKLGNKKLFVLLLSLIIFIALMGLTLSNRGKMTWPEKFITDSIAWTQGLFYKPAGYIAGFFEDIGKMNEIYDENKLLKHTLSLYARDRARLNTLEAENVRLKEALNYTERQKQVDNYTYHIAQVVSYSPDPYNHTLKINLGEKNQIKENMAVTSSEGLIGRVVRVSPFHSTVQLISNIEENASSTKAIAATVMGKDTSYGIIENYDQQEGLLMMTKIKQEDPLAVGDMVVSSGLGQVFPKGLLIGEVVSREVGEFGITHTARIRPAANLADLREVFVVEVPEM
jgi:rod shape-determining protein MreC